MTKESTVVCVVCHERISKRRSIEVASRMYCCPEHVHDWENSQSAKRQEEEREKKEREARERLEQYICESYGIEKPTATMRRQINKFKKEEGFSYQGMYLTLYYCFTLADTPAEPMVDAGVAIIPYFYDAAKKFYQKKRQIQHHVQEVDVSENGRDRVVTVQGSDQNDSRKKFLVDIEALGGEDE